MIAIDPATGEPLAEGLWIQSTPSFFRPYQIRCSGCGCSVGRDHLPNSDDCQEARRERDISQSDA